METDIHQTREPEPQPTIWKCSHCPAEATTKKSRMPKTWKRFKDALYCGDCWHKLYILRAITVPIARPVEIDWVAFRTIIREMWALTTQASNWITTELYGRDVRRLDQPKLEPMPASYLYPEVRRRFPALPSQTAAALEQSVKGRYGKKRYEVIWTCASSLPSYRYPTPFPIHNQSWSVSMEGGAAIVSARIGETRVKLKLQSGIRFGRQYVSIRRIVAGEAMRGEMAIYRQGKDVMCKMVAWLPRTGATAERDGAFTLKTTAESLVVGYNLKDEAIWVYNGDQLRRWAAEHRKNLERWSQDTKAEHRPVPPFSDRRADAAKRHHRRMATASHTIAAMIVNYAVRRRFATILYDDTDHSYVTEFPWAELALKISEKADAAGLEFIHTASAEADQKTP